jgi:predicted porin
MQKKIIALAIAAAFSAPAFADATLYGVVDAAVANVSATGQRSDTIAVSGGLASSRIGVVAAEDLDNGMKAIAKVEYSLDTQTADGIGGARQEMLAVAGGFGTFATGYLQTTGYDWAVKFDPTAGSLVSPLQSMTRGGAFLVGSATIAARAQRALAYISPDLSGVTVAVNYSTDAGLGATFDTVSGALLGAGAMYGGATGAGNLGQLANSAGTKIPAYLISATYTGMPNLAVGVVVAGASMNAAQATISDRALGASYDLGMVKLFGTYQTTKLEVTGAGDLGSSKAMSFSAVAPVGPGAVAFSYAKNTLANNTWGQNSSAKGYTVAWLQGLSKTTTLYAFLEKVSQGSATRAHSVGSNMLGGGLAAQGALVAGLGSMDLGGSSTAMGVGLNKKF